jgi:endo-1,4-beta-mannosidase
MDKALQTMREQLKKQREEKKYSQEKFTKFIETMVKELEEKKTITHMKQKIEPQRQRYIMKLLYMDLF